MAQSIDAAQSARLDSVSLADQVGTTPDRSLRMLKNRLQARFPSVRSSHLSEAIAAGLGFNTHAALRAAPAGVSSPLTHRQFQAKDFRRRLIELDYAVLPDFRFGEPAEPSKPPAQYRAWLDEILRLEGTPNRTGDRAYVLRTQCANEFAKTFGLGHLKDEDDTCVVKRWEVGVDHGACLPGWGDLVNRQHGSLVDFPGSDHRWRFYDALQKSGGAKPKTTEFCQAMVSMPYADKHEHPNQLAESQYKAGCIGWTCTELPEWSWHLPGSTTLVLYRRTTPTEALRRAWQGSFKRWVLENRTRLTRSGQQTRKYVVEDIIDCRHIPFDLTDFEDCRERYLREFAFSLYWDPTDPMVRSFERLMTKWAEESKEGVALA